MISHTVMRLAVKMNSLDTELKSTSVVAAKVTNGRVLITVTIYTHMQPFAIVPGMY